MKTFEELGVNEEIRRAITELGFEHPMPVQEEVIPYLLGHGNDVIALAQTGTGKTAAFGIPLLQRIDPTQRHTQAIVLSPTRELCLQIADDLWVMTHERLITGPTAALAADGTLSQFIDKRGIRFDPTTMTIRVVAD